MLKKALSFLVLGALLAPMSLMAHDGRRMDIVVINDQLFTQGYNSGADDQAPYVRPYQNAVHGHWSELGGTHFATLPGFDVTFGNSLHHSNGNIYAYGYQNDASDLVGHNLSLELIGAGKWQNPMAGQINLQPLSTGEVINLGYGSHTFNTDDIGTSAAAFDLITNWNNISDLDLNYSMSADPTGSLFYLEWQLSSQNPAITDSESVYVIFAPPGQLHHRALELESHFGMNAIPEPGSALVLMVCLAGFARFRRRDI